MDKGKLTQKQLYFMSSMYIFGTLFVTLPRSLTNQAEHAGWFCILAGMLLFAGYAYLLNTLMVQMQGQEFIPYVHALIGKWVGYPLTLLMLMVPTLFYSAFVMRLVAEMFSTLVMPETPVEAMMLMFVILRYWTVHGGIRSIGLLAELLVPAVLVVLVFMLMLSTGHTDYTRLLPAFDSDFKGLFSGSMSVLSVFMEAGVLLFAITRIQKVKDTWKSLLWVNVTVGILFLLVYWLCLGTFGAAYTKRLAFPTVEMIRNVSFLDYFEHLEIIFLATWVAMNIVKGSMTYYACCIGFQGWFGIKSYRSLMVPILIIVYYLALIPQNLLQAVFRFEQFKALVYPYYGLAAIVFMLGLGKWKKRKKGGAGS
jgi:spore germination protein KB